MMSIPAAKNWSHKFVPKFSIDLQLWDTLKYHFTYSADLSFWGTDSYVASKYYLSGNNKQTHTSASKSSSKGINWQVENTLTYDKTIGKHSFAVVLGQSAMKNKSDYLGGSRWNLVNVNKPSIDYATGNYVQTIVTDKEGKIISVGTPTIQHSVYGGNNVVHTILLSSVESVTTMTRSICSRQLYVVMDQAVSELIISMVLSHLHLLDGTS